MDISELLKKAKSLPKKPGCYLMKNTQGNVIYVGKALDLRSRVSSYFNKSSKTIKTEILVGHIRDFDFMLVDNDTEAFVLENNLIKKYSPKYNIRLRDDKTYPYVLVDSNEPYPRLHYVRKFKRGKGKEFFGPFVHGSNISEVLRFLQKVFGLRDCSLSEFKKRKEPCLLYQMGHCSAPCVGGIDPDVYNKNLEFALNFLKGKGAKSLKVLEKRMHTFAAEENFERAALVRDSIEILKVFAENSLQKNAELKGKQQDVDIIATHQGDIETDISIFMVRNGILLGNKDFHFPTIDITSDLEDEILGFLFQYYSTTGDTLPENIILPFKKSRLELFEAALNSLDRFSLTVKGPGRKFKSLIELTKNHAIEHQRMRLTSQESLFIGLNKLKELLSLKERPIKLECYDVAIWQGKSPTASQIVFIEGKADKKQYRYYTLKELPEGNNDFAMMREVLRRRLKYGLLPDVFIVDGGKGQVSVFSEVLKEFKLDIPVVGIAKAKSLKSKKTEERLIIPGRLNPYLLLKNRSLFKIIVGMRDEAHRFSRKLHHKHEKKRTFHTWLDDVKGVGPKTREKCLKRLDKNLDELREMGLEELRSYFDINQKIAANIKLYLDIN
ncbi:MAG: hypothetical protein DRQ89_13230 [Epsilonproteobacteria bacterium]|nr:MAG: hypothetical protein DRQ89_13230 [Campylobacterota bacterium]